MENRQICAQMVKALDRECYMWEVQKAEGWDGLDDSGRLPAGGNMHVLCRQTHWDFLLSHFLFLFSSHPFIPSACHCLLPIAPANIFCSLMCSDRLVACFSSRRDPLGMSRRLLVFHLCLVVLGRMAQHGAAIYSWAFWGSPAWSPGCCLLSWGLRGQAV